MTDEIQSATPESSGFSQFYYSIDEFDILLEPTVKTEIVEQRDIFPIPHAPEWCRGMISLRGKLLPVVNMHLLLGRKAQNQSHWLLIIESTQLPPVAVRIDKLPMQHLVKSDEFHSIEEKNLPFWLTSALDSDGSSIYKADHKQLLELLILQNQQAAKPSQKTRLTEDSSGNQA